MIDKKVLLQKIVNNLTHDLSIAMQAALVAHEAAINEETQPDNKYDTLSLESSYIAQGHANRGQELRKALQVCNNLSLHCFSIESPISMSALVELEYLSGETRLVFIAPAAGGMKIDCDGQLVNVITPEAPLAQALMGQRVGDAFSWGSGRHEGEIVALW